MEIRSGYTEKTVTIAEENLKENNQEREKKREQKRRGKVTDSRRPIKKRKTFKRMKAGNKEKVRIL